MKAINIVWISFFSLALLFHFYPYIDLYTSAQFYDTAEGFHLAENNLVYALYKSVSFMCAIFLCACIYWAYTIFKKKKSYKINQYIQIIYVLLVVAMGPGFLIHEVVKETFNRPRPRQIEQFGGEEKFTPAFEISTSRSELHSFVSGHAAAGFMFFALAFLMKGTHRKQMLIFSTTLGSFFGLIRIMQGGHFLSDVVFSGFLVYFTAYYLYKLLKPTSIA